MYFPKCIFPSDKLPRVFSQVFTSQMCNLISGNVPSHSARSPSSSKPQRPPHPIADLGSHPWLYLGNERKREIEIMLSRFSEQNSSWRDSLFFLNHSSNHYVSMYCLTILEQVSLSSVLSF